MVADTGGAAPSAFDLTPGYFGTEETGKAAGAIGSVAHGP